MGRQEQRNKYRQDERLKKVGAKLKELRKERGYASYEKFSYDYDLNRISYGKHEKGENMNLASLIEILDIYEITLSEFFKDID